MVANPRLEPKASLLTPSRMLSLTAQMCLGLKALGNKAQVGRRRVC